MNSLLSGFSGGTFWVGLRHKGITMFVFHRSAAAVLLPLVLLLAVALWSNLADGPPVAASPKAEPAPPTLVAQAHPEARQGS
jgi:hypothetical protein